MAAVGILGWRSCLADGQPLTIPDFKKKKARRTVAEDHWSPFPEDAGPGQPPPSLQGVIPPDKKAVAYARKQWRKLGYKQP